MSEAFGEIKFDDIEMLEIPDYDSTSETEAITDESSNGDDKDTIGGIFSTLKNELGLDDWLNTDKPLDFQFDVSEYKSSASLQHPFADAYTNYVNSLFKLIESLTSKQSDEQWDNFEEPVGLITSQTSQEARLRAKNEFINECFTNIIEHLQTLLEDPSLESTNPETDSRLTSTLHILLCLQSNYFYSEITNRPEFLCNWVNSISSKPSEELFETIMTSTPIPYLHPQFWNTMVSQFITRGRLSEAAEVISRSKFESLEETSLDLYNLISDFKLLLENYTSFSLKGQFAEWKLKACEFRDSFVNIRSNIIDDKEKIILSQIHDLANIITGLPKTIASYCDHWYEVYVAFALFQVRDNEELFKDFYKLALSEKPAPVYSTTTTELQVSEFEEQTFANILEENFLKVLETLYFLEPATAAYVAKLLEMKSYFNGYYVATSKASNLKSLVHRRTISEYFLTLHAYKCLNLQGLIPVGVGLLVKDGIINYQNSRVANKNIVAEVLPKYNFKTNDDLEWALTICAKLGLSNTAKQLHYKSGVKSLTDGYLFEALNRFVHCFDPTAVNYSSDNNAMKQVHYIAWDIIFQDSLINNRPCNDDLINNIVDNKVEKTLEIHPVIRQCLSPYAVLNEFFKGLKVKGNGPNSFSTYSKLIHLLRFNYLPKKYYPLLLSQFLPLLSKDSKTFDLQLSDLVIIIELLDTYEINVTEEENKEALSLYTYCIEHKEEVQEEYDWRKILKDDGVAIPQNLKQLFLALRGAIVAKIGKVYIDN
ncbi:protein in nuclear pore complex may function in nuclear envelope integrity may also be [Scheffersomyces amazonensis]|uniref:protein in nuclear pore complex may function in nuclear envelope integrity may also be n=1 Tax=Scheffersomyces amazonensis TaxID=1078765 RepID=UPI00315D28CE